ncbi:MAG: hypothetical protein AAB296_04935 [Candidatus Desantisbacteria bacterium]
MSTIAIPLIEKEHQEELVCLPQFYKVFNEDKVISFLKNYPFLLPILVEAPIEIYRIFPRDDINLELELHHDPEEDYDELFVVIKSPYSPQKARELMDKLDETWFLEIMDRAKNKLCITEEPL